jgi:hypothetical protein
MEIYAGNGLRGIGARGPDFGGVGATRADLGEAGEGEFKEIRRNGGRGEVALDDGIGMAGDADFVVEAGAGGVLDRIGAGPREREFGALRRAGEPEIGGALGENGIFRGEDADDKRGRETGLGGGKFDGKEGGLLLER